jgi:hypothetical protein
VRRGRFLRCVVSWGALDGCGELPLPTKMEFGKILPPAAEGADGAGAGSGGGEVLSRCVCVERRHDGGILSP